MFFRRPTEVARVTGEVVVDEAKYGDMARKVEVMDWDAEAQNEAMRKARELQIRDPESASLLIATLVVTQDAQEQQTGSPVSRAPVDYEPVKLYDFACKEYGWRPRDINEMHYLLFFALVNAANERRRREEDDLRTRMGSM